MQPRSQKEESYGEKLGWLGRWTHGTSLQDVIRDCSLGLLLMEVPNQLLRIDMLYDFKTYFTNMGLFALPLLMDSQQLLTSELV